MENSDIKRLKFLFLKILNSQGIKKVKIEEKNLNFSISVDIKKNQSLRDIRTILLAFEQIENATQNTHSMEIELFQPYLMLYLDRYD